MNTQKKLDFTTSEINKNFRIKINGFNFDGPNLNTLVGVSGLISLVGIELANNLIVRAFKGMEDCCDCKLRRGLRVRFYVK